MTTIAERFLAFASAYPDLALYHALSKAAAGDPAVTSLLDVAQPGQQRPVLLFAAVHDLVLASPDLELAKWYSSVTPVGQLAASDPWPTFRATCLEHSSELEAVIAGHVTQTNEVNRAVILAVLAAQACADTPQTPVSLVELGASAGLLLTPERYRIDIEGVVVGNLTSAVQCSARSLGPIAPELSRFPPRIHERVGIDRAPVDLSDADAVRWLQACLWPDQPWRIERFRAAVDQLRPSPPTVVAGDFIDQLPAVVSALDPTSHLVVFDSWALTYVAGDRRLEIPKILAAVAAQGRPVSWLSAEPPRSVPDIVPPEFTADVSGKALDTVLGLRRWRNGSELDPVALGWAHAHGNWVALTRSVL